MGTWQFESLSNTQAQELIATAKQAGIHQFDTAHVYAGGRAEQLLGDELDADDMVITKLPATDKRAARFEDAYPARDETLEMIALSVRRLRVPPSILLLHNWSSQWENQSSSRMGELKELCVDLGIQQFGVSLPNGYDGELETTEEYGVFDCVEAPFNDLSTEITLPRLTAMADEKAVYVRSLFKHGADATNVAQRIHAFDDTPLKLVIGATQPKQITDWMNV